MIPAITIHSQECIQYLVLNPRPALSKMNWTSVLRMRKEALRSVESLLSACCSPGFEHWACVCLLKCFQTL